MAAEHDSRDATIAPVAALARKRGIGTDQLALAWVLAHPFIDCALSGAATMEQLASHAAATEVSLDASERAAGAAAAMSPADYWERRATLRWS